MIVFRKQERWGSTAEALKHLMRLVSDLGQKLSASASRHAAAVELLIEYGEFESALMDSASAERDELDPFSEPLREAALLTGELLYESWADRPDSMPPILARLEAALGRMAGLALPGRVCFRVSEGFVHYGIVPETYIRAAEKFYRENRPERAVCIGIRSIGASLSAVVGSVLRRYGCDVLSWTLRPRGHPFDRFLDLAPDLAAEMKKYRHDFILLVDEGPGLSGSSLCSAARFFSELGVKDGRIVLFPCWEPDGSDFISEDARARWTRHAKYSARFEEVWMENGRLAASLPRPELTDISAGNWRWLVYKTEGQTDPSSLPAVHPHHEQRKYLCGGNGHTRHLAKFAGLGRYGRVKQSRMERLASAGFVPAPNGLANGFLISPFIEGRPFSQKEFIRGDLLRTIAEYIAFIGRSFPAPDGAPSPEEMLEMIRINVEEGLGPDWLKGLDGVQGLQRIFEEGRPVGIDGRMFPHEWIRTERGFLKSDSVDHHMDQFFPRCQDPAWDIAGTCIEFALDRQQKDYLIDRYQSLTKDGTIRRKLPGYSIAYLAYRLGYTTLAADSLGPEGDGMRFRAMAERYRVMLQRLIRLHS